MLTGMSSKKYAFCCLLLFPISYFTLFCCACDTHPGFLPTSTVDHPHYIAEVDMMNKSKEKQIEASAIFSKLLQVNVDAHHEMEMLMLEKEYERELLTLKNQSQDAILQVMKDVQDLGHESIAVTRNVSNRSLQVCEDRSLRPPTYNPPPDSGACRIPHERCDLDDIKSSWHTEMSAQSAKGVATSYYRMRDSCSSITGAGECAGNKNIGVQKLEHESDSCSDDEYVDILDIFHRRI